MSDRSLLAGVSRQHAGDFLGPDPSFHPRKARRRPSAGDFLLDPVMIIGANGDGGEMRNAKHLLGLPELLEVLADGYRHLLGLQGTGDTEVSYLPSSGANFKCAQVALVGILQAKRGM